ncbi:DUF2786 domain-containing protein [Actinopolymorpha pittospori]
MGNKPTGTSGRSSDSRDAELLFGILRAAVDAAASGATEAAAARARTLADPRLGESTRDLLDGGVGTLLDHGLRGLWECGWQPRDVAEYARRLSPVARAYLLEAMVARADRHHPRERRDPRWQAQLDELAPTTTPPMSADDVVLSKWSSRRRLDRPSALEMAVSVLGLLAAAPALTPILPPPGGARAPGVRGTRDNAVEEKILGRIRALLAKAESTEFPEEAEALSAKAQMLMTRFSLDDALLEAAEPARGHTAAAGVRRIWLTAPYVGAKALLAHVVARANRCRAVSDDRIGYVNIVGADIDLELVEILTTSLLLQANRAMLGHGRQVDGRGASRTRSWRQSFLVSYATRIGERLTEAGAASQATLGEDQSARLLPVLAAREQQVEHLFAELFPRTRTHAVSVSNPSGWAAGRVAADLADLRQGRQAVGQRTSA